MTDKQKEFADEYILWGDVVKAYMSVYKNVKSIEKALVAGNKLLDDFFIKEYIAKNSIESLDSKAAGEIEVLEYLTAIVRGEETEEVVVKENCGRGVSQTTILDKKISVKDRLKAAELIGKRYKMFTDKMEIQSAKVIKIIDDIPGDVDE